MHALIAVGPYKVGDKSFYAGMKETASPSVQVLTCNPTDLVEKAENTDDNMMNIEDQITDTTNYDEGEQNLDLILNVMEEQDKLKQDVLTVHAYFTVVLII